jgi:cytochrome c oxidase cbb3-type subunit 2
MERFGASFLIAGVVTFLLGFFLQGVMPMLTLRKVPIRTVEEIAATVPQEFEQLAEDYPEEFQKAFGEPNPASFARALTQGRDIYIAEACWHCHSQFVRPVSNEDLRFGPVSTSTEYQNEMNLPHLFGTRRVGPDLVREAGKRSNDWHVAHLYDPRSVVPYSVMPGYPWMFDADRRPTERALSVVAYLQWLGSWVHDGVVTDPGSPVALAASAASEEGAR